MQGREQTRLHGRPLAFARAAWIVVVALMLCFFIMSIPAHLSQLATISDAPQMWLQLLPAQARTLLGFGLSVHFYAVYLLVFQIVVVMGFAGLSLLIFGRRSDDGMAIFVSLVSILYGVTSVPVGQTLAQTYSGWRLPVGLLNAIGWGSGLLLFYLFPDGHFVPRWTRWLTAVMAAWVLAWPFFPALNPDQWAFPLPFLTKLAWYSTGIFAQVYRYTRHSTQLERQQTKWAVFGFTAAFVGFFVFNAPVVLVSTLQESSASRLLYLLIAYPLLALLPLLLAPLSLGFACLRYRLWEIDFIVNRTLVYSTLTVTLAVIYFVSVVFLQVLFRSVVGQGQPAIVIVISTLAIAALFAPLRRRVQTGIDWRFYRRKYDAAQTLAAFSATLRDEVNLDQLKTDLLAVVEETMQPTHISLWLRGSRQRKDSDV
jgi:hypothetical protein